MCVFQVYPTLLEQNVSIKMKIFKVLVETCLVSMRKTAYKSYRIMFFENVKSQKVFCDG